MSVISAILRANPNIGGKIEHNHCVGKTRYVTRREAEIVREYRAKRYEPPSAYRCKTCKFWHLGRTR